MSPNRNSPCPCGSGKRYKQCCGALGSAGTEAGGKAVSLGATMLAALDAQRRNDLLSAKRLYQEVLELEPANIDALHMLGVVHFTRGELDPAERLIRHALALAPTPNRDINHNLVMLKEARASSTDTPEAMLRIVRESQVAELATEVQLIAPAQTLVLPPIDVPQPAGSTSALPATFPQIIAFDLEHAVVDAESEFPTNDQIAVFPDLLDFTRHLPTEFRYRNLEAGPPFESVAHFRQPDNRGLSSLPSAVVLTSSHWSNWAHFLTEQLPKVLLADDFDPWRNRPFLVSAVGLGNAHHLCRRLVSPQRTILQANGRIRVSRAGYISTVGYCPFEYKPVTGRATPPIRATDAIFSPHALDRVRRRAHEIVSGPGEPALQRLYLRRNAAMRRIVNADEVDARFVRHGFTIVAPEGLPVEEQIRLMRSSGMIAGQSGAALANMIFMPPGGRVLALAAYSVHNNFHYFANMAQALGHRLDYLFCEPRGNPHHPAHADLEVDVARLDEILESLRS
jgi:hypothetical protein